MGHPENDKHLTNINVTIVATISRIHATLLGKEEIYFHTLSKMFDRQYKWLLIITFDWHDQSVLAAKPVPNTYMSQGLRISGKIGVLKVMLIIGLVEALVVISGAIKPLLIIKALLKLLRNGTVSFNKINDSMDRHLKLNMVSYQPLGLKFMFNKFK